MHPIFMQIGPVTIHWYGVMAATGFLAAILHWNLLGRREGRSPDFGSNLAFWLMICGIGGARLAYVAANWNWFSEHPGQIIRIDQGGLIYYGGLIGGIVAALVIGLRSKEPLGQFGDFVISALPLGHAFGRIGCFLNGCCYGAACSCPWSVRMHDIARHPVQLYEAAANFLIYGLLLHTLLRRSRPGTTISLYLLTYPPLRFLLEFIRGDERMTYAGLSLAQWISLALFAAGLVLLFNILRNRKSARA